VAIYENLTQFAGKNVVDWEPGEPVVTKQVYRLRIGYEDESTWGDKFAAFLDDPGCAKVEALVIGDWGRTAEGNGSGPVVEAVAAARDRLAKLTALFLGDMTSEESEISWINQSDVSPILEGYPNLEHFTIRGGQSLSLGSPRHGRLRELVIQTGGLPPAVIHEVASAELPALEHLELWLGEPNYGGDATVEDLAALLKGDRFPKLKYLGLKNSVIQDEIAGVVALAPVTARLETLDLSMGTLGDGGAKALLGSPAIKELKRLDIHHHYVSDELVAKLKALKIDVDDSEKEEPDDWGGGELHRYIAVSE
jgi:hypothetical protein